MVGKNESIGVTRAREYDAYVEAHVNSIYYKKIVFLN